MDRLHEDEVHNLGYVDSGVEHVDRDGNTGLIVLLESGDQAVAPRAVVDPLDIGVDELHHADVLGIHLFEDVAQPCRMGLGEREDDGLAGYLTRLVLDADIHHFGPLLAQRVLV